MHKHHRLFPALLTCLFMALPLALGQGPAEDPPHVVVIHGEPEYGSSRTMPPLARQIRERFGFQTTVLASNRSERGDLPDLSALEDADLLVLFIRFRLATDSQFQTLKNWFDTGKPAVAFRTTSHGFWEDKGWFVPFFGGHYKSHADNEAGTTAMIVPDQFDHPLLRGVDAAFHLEHGGTYNTQPLSDFATPLILGKTGGLPSEPVAWIAEYRPRQRLFYTSLGAEENFENPSFYNLVLNSVLWCLEKEVPANGAMNRSVAREAYHATESPSPPKRSLPEDATPLFTGESLDAWKHWDPSVPPRAIGIDERADTTPGGPVFESARWKQAGGVVEARPGFGDILTKESFQDGVYHLDFLIPEQPDSVPDRFHGNSGVFIDGKWEIQIIDSYGRSEIDDRNTCGAIFGIAAPLENACRPPGEWQEMEIAVRHSTTGAEISVWLNGARIHDQVPVSDSTLYGFLQEEDEDEEEMDEATEDTMAGVGVEFNEAVSKKSNWSRNFTLEIEFRTEEDGPLALKANPDEDFRDNDKALYIRDGRLHFKSGTDEELSTNVFVDDGDWHRAVLRSDRGTVALFVDGERAAQRQGILRPDAVDSRLLLGLGCDGFPMNAEEEPLIWEGQIDSFRFFDRAVSMDSLNERNEGNPVAHWRPGMDQSLDVASGEKASELNMGEAFTVVVRFRDREGGPLFAKAPETGIWVPNGKVLYVRNGRLVYDIGWLGALVAEEIDVSDGEWHVVAVTHRDGLSRLYVDGELVNEAEDFRRPDVEGHVFKVGACSTDFPPGHSQRYDGSISQLGFKKEAMSAETIARLNPAEMATGDWDYIYQSSTPTASEPAFALLYPEFEEGEEELEEEEDLHENGGVIPGGPLRLQADSAKVRFANIWMQPLSEVDHSAMIRDWDEEALARGRRIYNGICITCHGNLEVEGTLPTSRKFWEAEFKNGRDPYSLISTLGQGFEQMPAFPFLNMRQRYDVIHYIREALVKPTNPNQYFEVTDQYLSFLPKGMGTRGRLTEEMIDYAEGPKYLRMNFGPMLNWTYEAAPGNIAYKAIAVRLDKGPGGVSKGRAWMLFDHDTLRVAAAWSGNEFIDWKGIALDQSHGTHASIVGDKAYVNPVGPGWAHPESGTWEDPRFLGRDGKPYGPLPKDWAQFQGQYLHGTQVVLSYTVGDAEILEMPGMEESGSSFVYTRTLNVGKSSNDLKMRVAPANASATLAGGGEASLTIEENFHVLQIPADATPLKIKFLSGDIDAQTLAIAALVAAPPEDLSAYTQGGPPRWIEPVVTQGRQGGDDKAFEVDEIVYPEDNPWHSWMRIGGFDFFPDGKRAAVATWLGDVWIVDGIDGELKELRWRRICTGLFQPLGVKIVDGAIHVTCRDQLAKLHDLNGDEEIDFIECFNNDHQVTEHFHEFAMGLQTDDEGNFYYAKSARHALPALVPHHGTLLKVSADGSETEILAVGFRAANGVCLNPDGTYIVTDQEGHWNPKNRINYVKKGGFYGNMMGYHDVTDSSDEAMEQPLCWITNEFDRSPGELVWVPEDSAWGPFKGQLLNLSYGMGRVFLVPHEIIDGQAQGGMVSLGLDFPTGVMRGRFHPANGQLYAAGMFAWAGNKHRDGGFYRIRYTGEPALLPVELEAYRSGIHLKFSEPLDPEFASNPANYAIKIWDIKRTQNYGSRHYNEHALAVGKATVAKDNQSVFLTIPEIQPTWCMEILANVKSQDGAEYQRRIHNTIHRLRQEFAF